MARIKKINIRSASVMCLLINGAVGLFGGVIVSLLVWTGVAPSAQEDPLFIFGGWSVLLLPLAYGFIGSMAGIIFSWLFNLVASRTGGLIVDIES